VRCGSTKGPFGEGEDYFVAVLDHETVAHWLAEEQPWGIPWKQGPLDGKIWLPESFGTTDINDEGNRASSPWRSGKEELRHILSSPGVFYSGLPRELKYSIGYVVGEKWMKGKIIVLDPETGYVWFMEWVR
jgi:hypothetical protein